MTPTKESAELEGYIARTGGQRLIANPYLGSPLWFDWNRGWMRAKAEEIQEVMDDESDLY